MRPKSPRAVTRPTGGTPGFRRNCWVGVVDGALVANDRKNRTHEFALDGTERAPHSHRIIIPDSGPPQRHYIDRNGEAVIVLSNGACWDAEEGRAVAEAAGLVFDSSPVVPALRVDGIKLEDSSWAEMRNIRMALVTGIVLVTLGRFEVIGLFPWIFVALGLMGYLLAALVFSGVYFGKYSDESGNRPPKSSAQGSGHKRRKRRP